MFAVRLRADGLGFLVGVVAVRLLELVDESDVLLLGLLDGLALVDDLLPRVVLGLALQVEHAGLGGIGDLLASADLVQGVELEELIVARLLGKLLAVDDSLLEGFALRGRHGVCEVRLDKKDISLKVSRIWFEIWSKDGLLSVSWRRLPGVGRRRKGLDLLAGLGGPPARPRFIICARGS